MTTKFYGFDSSLVHDAAPEDGFCIDMVRASEYVKLESEVAALQEQVRALAAEVYMVKEAIEHHAACEANCPRCGWAEPCFTDDVVSTVRGISTPTTDATLREIRARAVEGFAKHLRSHMQDGSPLGLLAIGADEFAEKIRAGEQP